LVTVARRQFPKLTAPNPGYYGPPSLGTRRSQEYRSDYFFIYMYLNREIVRLFIDKVGWVTPHNIVVLTCGEYVHPNDAKYKSIRAQLHNMLKIKDHEKRLKHLPAIGHSYKVYASPKEKRHIISGSVNHDIKLRDVLAKYFHGNHYQDLENLSLGRVSETFCPDAYIDMIGKRIYFEMDNGGMSVGNLKKKLSDHYAYNGVYCAIFISAVRELYHISSFYDARKYEPARLQSLIFAIKSVLERKPNRILINSYSNYLNSGELFNFRMQPKQPFSSDPRTY